MKALEQLVSILNKPMIEVTMFESIVVMLLFMSFLLIIMFVYSIVSLALSK